MLLILPDLCPWRWEAVRPGGGRRIRRDI